MEKKRGRPRNVREASPPPSSRTRSKSPARVETSGRDSAPIIKKRASRSKKNETPSEEISSSSQSSTPKKTKVVKNEKQATIILDDSGDNEEVANINSRLATLRKRLTPANYKNTPTPTEDKNRSVSRTASSLTKEDSDENDDDEEVKVVPKEQKHFQDLGIFSKPIINCLLLILLSVTPIILSVCFQTNWKWSKFLIHFKHVENFFNVQAISFILAIHSGVALLSLLPVGRYIKLPDSETELKFNGILTTLIIIGFLFALELKGLNAFIAIYNNLDQLLFLSILRSFLGSIEVFLLSKYRPSSESNAYGRSGKFIIDFTVGRELNPKLLNFDLKQVHYNESIIYLLIINISLLFKNVSIPIVETIPNEGNSIIELLKQTYSNTLFILNNSEYNSAAFIISSLLILYALDLLIHEHHLSSSFQLNYEGMGAEILCRFASFPFLISLLPRYLFVQNITVNFYLLAIIVILFIIGLLIKRCSNSLKYEYRIHPSDPKFKELSTIPTFQNRRLIISKWFRKIRQPNLLGEILMHLALAITLVSSFNLATFLGIFIIIFYLIYRSISINRKNAIRYESSWQRYISAVPNNLLPRVY
ncbi:hypothetical protein PVAND_011720 [Polypedilum vanderplanki]|uniref:Uncharacterized protein n=1 Tax=Polypedilum vanderplanki TaxID=319348 RepID=A0A9J6CK50_POLVA|nr:hypothetical protein PVAND_011720 [Polypedilum vanderplanki]